MIQVYTVTARDILTAYLAMNALVLLAVLAGMWVAWPQARVAEAEEPAPESGDDPDATVEIKPRSRGHRTGITHAPQYGRAAVVERSAR